MIIIVFTRLLVVSMSDLTANRIIVADGAATSLPNSLPNKEDPSNSNNLKQTKMVSAKESVESQIAASPVVVYSKSYCPYCTKTKTLLTELGAKFEVVELDQIDGGSEQQDALEDLTGQSTVPNVFVGGKSIGGNSDVRKLHKAGNLEPLLKQNGAL